MCANKYTIELTFVIAGPQHHRFLVSEIFLRLTVDLHS